MLLTLVYDVRVSLEGLNGKDYMFSLTSDWELEVDDKLASWVEKGNWDNSLGPNPEAHKRRKELEARGMSLLKMLKSIVRNKGREAPNVKPFKRRDR